MARRPRRCRRQIHRLNALAVRSGLLDPSQTTDDHHPPAAATPHQRNMATSFWYVADYRTKSWMRSSSPARLLGACLKLSGLLVTWLRSMRSYKKNQREVLRHAADVDKVENGNAEKPSRSTEHAQTDASKRHQMKL